MLEIDVAERTQNYNNKNTKKVKQAHTIFRIIKSDFFHEFFRSLVEIILISARASDYTLPLSSICQAR